MYHLREIQQVVEKTWRKTRRYQKLPETEAANRVGVFRAQSPRYSSSCSKGAPYEPSAMPNRRIAQRLVESYLCYGQCIGRLTQAVYVMFALGPEIAATP